MSSVPFALPPLYPILDASCFPPEPAARAAFLSATVRELARAGVTLLQLRMKDASRDEVLSVAAILRAAVSATAMRLILNDHAEWVLETGFDGVHLGQGDLALGEARALLGPDRIVGLSTHTPGQAVDGDATSADYLAVGPVFSTASKPDAESPVGLEGVRAARARTGKPLVAIGGIGMAQAQAVRAAGADSVAVIGALFGSQGSPGRLAQDFLRLFR